jgi:ribosome-interacting GTPase 1
VSMNTLRKPFVHMQQAEKIQAIEEEIRDTQRNRERYPIHKDYFDKYEANLKKDLQELKRGN